jgi:hypothetical protein
MYPRTPPGSNLIKPIFFILFSSILAGCAFNQTETLSATQNPGTTRFTGDTRAYHFYFNLNGNLYSLARGATVDIPFKEGMNEVSNIWYENIYGQKYRKNSSPNRRYLEDDSLYFYIPKENSSNVITITLSATSPTQIVSYTPNRQITNVSFTKPTRAFHRLTFEPSDAEVYEIGNEGQDKILVASCHQTKECILSRDIIGRQYVFGNFLVRWPEYDHERRIEIRFENGSYNTTALSPSDDSIKWLRAQVEKLKDQPERQIEFICSKNLRATSLSYNDCITAERADRIAIAEAEKAERVTKERMERLHFLMGLVNRGQLKPELRPCEIYIKSGIEDGFAAFEECTNRETKRQNAKNRYAAALNTAEGKACEKDSPSDEPAFWDCYSRRQELTSIRRVDVVANQCLEIGFEYKSDGYKDCYVKLKVHLEQIAQWRQLQDSIERVGGLRTPVTPPQVQSSVRPSDSGDAAAYFEVARRAFESTAMENRASPGTRSLAPPPPPVRINTPNGNSINCRMMGASLNCR